MSDIQISRKTERHGVARSTKIVVNDVTGVTRPNGPNLVEIRLVFLETRMESVLITIMKRWDRGYVRVNFVSLQAAIFLFLSFYYILFQLFYSNYWFIGAFEYIVQNTSISRLNKKNSISLRILESTDNLKREIKSETVNYTSSNSYHTNSRVKSIWPVEMVGSQQSLANFRKIVIYNFGPTAWAETTLLVRLLFFVTEKTSIPSFPKLFVCSEIRVGYSEKEGKKESKGEKIKKNPREGCFVKSYSRSWRAFVQRFMHPVSRRQFQRPAFLLCNALSWSFSPPFLDKKTFTLSSSDV